VIDDALDLEILSLSQRDDPIGAARAKPSAVVVVQPSLLAKPMGSFEIVAGTDTDVTVIHVGDRTLTKPRAQAA
jgi:hypothetical protein